MKNATAIGEKYPKLKTSVEECRWCEIVWEHLYQGAIIEEIGDSCDKCGRCVACCGDDPCEYCKECKVEGHDVCSMTDGCPCCDETKRQLSS